MQKNEKIYTNLYLPCEIFNSLMSVLEYFIETESQTGKTFFSEYSKALSAKFLKHGRVFHNERNDNEESVSLKLYGNDSAILNKLMIYYISLGEKPSKIFSASLKKRRQNFQ